MHLLRCNELGCDRPPSTVLAGNNLYDNGLSPATQASIDAFVNFVLAGMAHFEGNRIIWEMWNVSNP